MNPRRRNPPAWLRVLARRRLRTKAACDVWVAGLSEEEVTRLYFFLPALQYAVVERAYELRHGDREAG